MAYKLRRATRQHLAAKKKTKQKHQLGLRNAIEVENKSGLPAEKAPQAGTARGLHA